MEANIARIITIFTLLIVTLLVGIIPYFIIRRGRDAGVSRTREKILSYLNCFAGGVFLGTALLHLLVKGGEELEEVLANSYNVTGYPVFEALVGTGFFMIALVEQLVLLCVAGVAITSSPVMKTKQSNAYDVSYNNNGFLRENIEKGSNEQKAVDDCGLCDHPVAEANKPDHYVNHKPFTPTVQIESDRPIDDSDPSEVERISHAGDIEHLSTASGIRAFLLLIALSFHTIFDGLAIGLQPTAIEVWEVFGAISIHKTLVSFCLGLQLFRAFQPYFKKAFLSLFVFSFMSPIGIVLAIALTSSNLDKSVEKMTSGVLQGIACGTFFYVTCFEILRDEVSHKSSIPKVIICTVGFGAMVLVKLLDKE